MHFVSFWFTLEFYDFIAPSFTVGYQESICCDLGTSDFYGCSDIGGLGNVKAGCCVVLVLGLSLGSIVHGALCFHEKRLNCATVCCFSLCDLENRVRKHVFAFVHAF